MISDKWQGTRGSGRNTSFFLLNFKNPIVPGLLSLVPWLLISSCKIYSFTGASIPPEVKTVTVQNFTNQSENGNTAINLDLTNQLKNKFLSETNLSLTDASGDIEFRGSITGYNIRGLAPSANQTTELNRLTITVKVDYVNNITAADSWSQTFSRYDDYDGTRTLAEVETQLYQSINSQIAEDIFNRAFVNW